MDSRAPIITFGAGRSGSTLLCDIFDSHPKISYGSESLFTPARMWEIFFDPMKDIFMTQDRDYAGFMRWHYWWNLYRGRHSMEMPEYMREQEKRICGLIAQMVLDAFDLDPTSMAWGFKELWNGSCELSQKFDWEIYDKLFPRAWWVHNMRNPFTFIPSSIGLETVEHAITRDLMFSKIELWMSVVRHSRTRKAHPRCFEVRYEDLTKNPKAALMPLLNAVGVGWDDKCMSATRKTHVPSTRNYKVEFMEVYRQGEICVPGFYELVEEFGYVDEIKAMGIPLVDDRKGGC